MTAPSLPSLLWAPLLFAALLWPLLLALRPLLQALIAPDQPRAHLDWLWISAPAPALALAVLGLDGRLWLEAWLFGGRWELDGQRRLLLTFTALLWGLAGWYARGYLAAEQRQALTGDPDSRSRLLRFALFWPLTLCGNLLLLVAEDIASFYLGFALMTFAAYPLVIHTRSRAARTGGLAYLVMAVLGEGVLLAGLLWAAGTGSAFTLTELRATLATADAGVWMGLLLWLGFGVKAGVIGLHLWLPLAHPVAPTPASAVLSGVMIKAGLVGWLSALPLGMPGLDGAFRGLGLTMLWVGLLGAFAAALWGVAQRQPKAVLAYSSVSQMGMITALVAVGLLQPDSWPAVGALVVLFAAHHGLSKGALFLGVGISERAPPWPAWLLWSLLTLPALSLSGALGSGLLTKWGIKTTLDGAGEKTIALWLSLATVGTTALMVRALWRQWLERAPAGAAARRSLAPMPMAWVLSVLAALGLPFWAGTLAGTHTGGPGWPPLGALPTLLWPLGLGLLLSLVLGWSLRRIAPWLNARLPAGDLWWPLAAAGRGLWRLTRRMLRRLAAWQAAWVAWWVARERDGLAGLDTLTRAEGWLRRQLAVLLLAVAAGLAAVLLLSAESTPLWPWPGDWPPR
ncbi:complex I subunit 5 family protein [uncultured Thiohalocapsa sp.]|uniref:complex I subunit 5 family protein n=1 Tax=uncultured Thiohalocapsa sp. TaxID=768990 RepID=UPI0025DA48C4|nr:complex I subunit 5 family protein [uncultured Thiohalocapsa sp.]